MKRSLLLLVLSLCATSLPIAFSAEPGQADPRLAVNLLDYVAVDYSGAVKDGKILRQSEYDEQVEFIATALRTLRALPEARASGGLVSKVEMLQALIARKGEPAEVARLAQEAKRELIEVAHVAQSPESWPDLRSGQKIFVQNCAACHGVTGHGDGPAGKSLEPRPADFHGESMAESSPFKSFNVIRVGVPGTAMAPWNGLSDKEVWELAFYVNSLRFSQASGPTMSDVEPDDAALALISSRTDSQVLASLRGSEDERKAALVALRTHSGGGDGTGGGTLTFARKSLGEALQAYSAGDRVGAKTLALRAYLEGVEPVEPKLKANDPGYVSALEEKMASVRSAIEKGAPQASVSEAVQAASAMLDAGDRLLEHHDASPLFTFILTCGIFLREGFEAVLILIALLAVIRATGSPRAARWVHGGWVVATALGFVAWAFSGWVMALSGAGRELMEAVIGVFAVAVLLYMGFWLHSRTEIHRWKRFIDDQVKSALEGSNLMGLALIAFMAVFREVFEVVLFLRAVYLDGGEGAGTALGAGVAASFAVLLLSSWALLKFSRRLPIRRVFSFSSLLMILLAVILAGKGIHSFQETGLLPVTASPLFLRVDLLGLFPTQETWIAQLLVLALSVALWVIGKRPARSSAGTRAALTQP